MTSDAKTERRAAAEVLTGRLAEHQELVETLLQRPGLLVISADPWSGTSDLLKSALEQVEAPSIMVDARRCRDALDLAMAIADGVVAALAPEADRWWVDLGASTDVPSLELLRQLSSQGIDPEDLRVGSGEGTRRLRDAVTLLAGLADNASLVIDHIGPMLSAMPSAAARRLLATLRANRQEHPEIDLTLVEYPEGPLNAALGNPKHPLYRAGAHIAIRRAHPAQFVNDLAVTRAWTDAPTELVGAAAELASGVPTLVWRVLRLAPRRGSNLVGRALDGWRALRELTDSQTAHQWELLRRVHPTAQLVLTAMSVGLRPHSVEANPKSVNDALKRLREVGLAWRTERGFWTLADPVLTSWTREHASPWAARRTRLAEGQLRLAELE